MLDELVGDERVAKTRHRALRGLEKLDARHTVSATLQASGGGGSRPRSAALAAEYPILYGQFAGRRNLDIDDGGALEGSPSSKDRSLTIDEAEEDVVGGAGLIATTTSGAHVAWRGSGAGGPGPRAPS